MIIESQAVGPFFKNGFVIGCPDTREAILIDPGDEVAELLAFADTNALSIRHILLTHAHIDHSGRLPLLVKNGFHGPIYTTPATIDLCNAMLRDTGHIAESDAEFVNRKHPEDPPVEPLYTVEDAVEAMRLAEGQMPAASFLAGFRATFWSAGVVAGLAGFLVLFATKRSG